MMVSLIFMINLCSVEGNFHCCPSCNSVSDLAEVVAGYRSLKNILAIYLKDVITAMRDERSIRQRHTLITEGDDCVSLQGRKKK